jgi:hypothetical protein
MNEQNPTIVDELILKLTEIKDTLKSGNVDAFVFEKLSQNGKLLQDKINDLATKKGFYTQSDLNDAYALLQQVKRGELEADSKKAIKRLIGYSVLGVAIFIGIYVILKRK